MDVRGALETLDEKESINNIIHGPMCSGIDMNVEKNLNELKTEKQKGKFGFLQKNCAIFICRNFFFNFKFLPNTIVRGLSVQNFSDFSVFRGKREFYSLLS